MPRRNQGLIAAGLLLALAACTTPAGTGTPAASASPASARPESPAPAVEPSVTPTASASPAAGSFPTTIDAEGVDGQDAKALAALLDSDDVWQYWGGDLVSDGSGAYFTAQALLDRTTEADPLRQRLAARDPLPILRRFRKHDFVSVSRLLRIRMDGADAARLDVTVQQQGAIDVETQAESRSIAIGQRQRQSFWVRRVDGRWQLAGVGGVLIEPDHEGTTLTVQRLTAQADGQTVLDLSADMGDVPVAQLPTLKPGQTLDIRVSTVRSDSSPVTGVIGIMRLPRLGGAARLQPDAADGTFSRSVTVPDRPGLYRAGAEFLDLFGLTDDPQHLDVTVWGFSFRIAR